MNLYTEVVSEMVAAGLSGLRKAVIALPVVWTGAWLGYYGGFSHIASAVYALLIRVTSLHRHHTKIAYTTA